MASRRHRALLLAALLARSWRCSDAVFLSCLQRAFGLLAPCQASFAALSSAPTAPGGGVDLNAALAALGGSLAALPLPVRQCCAALAPVNEANCLCDKQVADAVSAFTASATASAGSIMPQIEQVCGYALKVTQPSGACAASPAAQTVSQPPRPPPPEEDIWFTIQSTVSSPIVPISYALDSTRTASPPPLVVQSAPAAPTAAHPVAVLALAGAVDEPACPVPPPPMLSLALCAGLCRSDADCRAGSACCSNGCGRVCYAAPPQ